jgi:hypothetical protein
MTDFSFDSTQVKELDNKFEPLPGGKYSAVIDNTEIKDTKAGNGRYIVITYKITSGPASGRLVFVNYNIENPSQVAVDIGMSQLKQVCEAVGKPKFENLYELHGSPILLTLAIKRDEKYGDSNIVKRAESLTGSPAARPTDDFSSDALSAAPKPTPAVTFDVDVPF